MVPSLLRYNKSNYSLKEPISVEEAIMNPINALKESTKKIKIVRGSNKDLLVTQTSILEIPTLNLQD